MTTYQHDADHPAIQAHRIVPPEVQAVRDDYKRAMAQLRKERSSALAQARAEAKAHNGCAGRLILDVCAPNGIDSAHVVRTIDHGPVKTLRRARGLWKKITSPNGDTESFLRASFVPDSPDLPTINLGRID